MTYANSVEEQRYLTALRRETAAFEGLVEEKKFMSLPDWRKIAEGDASAAQYPNQGETAEERRMATDWTRPVADSRLRKGPVEQPAVVVDVREFRSKLPSLLHAVRDAYSRPG